MRRAKLLLDLVLVFLFTAVLIKPLFRAKYLQRWDSIESTFIADGRFLKDHWPHPQWQPLWYCGTRYDYLYPPAVRYGTALFARVLLPSRRITSTPALLYSSRSRGSLFSGAGDEPVARRGVAGGRGVGAGVSRFFWSFRGRFACISLRGACGSCCVYGEGPHVCSLSLLPFALGFAWLGIERRRAPFLVAAGIFSALVALTNFYGATALAIFYPILVWSLWVTHRDNRIWLRRRGDSRARLRPFGFLVVAIVPAPHSPQSAICVGAGQSLVRGLAGRSDCSVPGALLARCGGPAGARLHGVPLRRSVVPGIRCRGPFSI